MARVLLLVPSATYRVADFLEAARTLGVDVVIGGDEAHSLEGLMGPRSVQIPLDDPEKAAEAIVAHDRRTPLDAVVAVDDRGTWPPPGPGNGWACGTTPRRRWRQPGTNWPCGPGWRRPKCPSRRSPPSDPGPDRRRWSRWSRPSVFPASSSPPLCRPARGSCGPTAPTTPSPLSPASGASPPTPPVRTTLRYWSSGSSPGPRWRWRDC